MSNSTQAEAVKSNPSAVKGAIDSLENANLKARDIFNVLYDTKARLFGHEPENAVEAGDPIADCEMSVMNDRLGDLHNRLGEINQLAVYLSSNV